MEPKVANMDRFHCSRLFSGSVSTVEVISVEYVGRIIKITPVSNCYTVKKFIRLGGKVPCILGMYTGSSS
jgi:hypothetical protein